MSRIGNLLKRLITPEISWKKIPMSICYPNPLNESFERDLFHTGTGFIDFWVWKNYYDQLLEVFKTSYESFGNVSVMLLARLNYLLRHLPQDLKMYESNVQICLLELYRARVIGKSLLLQLFDLDLAGSAREQIILNIERHMGIFIYENDLDTIIRNSQALWFIYSFSSWSENADEWSKRNSSVG